MEAAPKLKQLLAERAIPFVEEWGFVTVKARTSSGFDVSLKDGEEISVFFEGWHGHFSDPEEAIRCFMAGLSSSCRIRVTERGGKPHKWVLERSRDGQWIPYATTGLLFFQYWRLPKTRYRQNGI